MLDSVKDQYEVTNHRGGIQNRVHLKAEIRKSFVSEATLEKIAVRALTGGFNIAKTNLCHDCNEFKSVNGSCGC